MSGLLSGVPVEQTMWQAVRLRDGKLSWWSSFRTEAEALEAAGLSKETMSRNVETIHRLYEAATSSNPQRSIEDLLHAEAEWVPDPRLGEGVIHGRERIIDFFLDRGESFGELRVEVERVWEIDDKVLAFVRMVGQGAASGAGFDIRIAHLWTLRDGVAVRGEGYGAREKALEAAGLPDHEVAIPEG